MILGTLSAGLWLAAASTINAQQLPEVDLGYSTYRATTLNTTGKYYTFSNIRYAAPPLGDLRFRAPAPPVENRSAVFDGSEGYNCPQASPDWWKQTFKERGNYTNAIPSEKPQLGENEDCLFLDVAAPANKFENGKAKKNATLSPVLIWIHGGGFFSGDKSTLYHPAGFFNQSDDNIVYMSMNFRLGAMGFLAGNNETGNETEPNAGLLDQRQSLWWVNKYIHLFGGDPKNVTLWGQSAGAGSVMHHTTWLSGKNETENSLFQQIIVQSPVPGMVFEGQQRNAFNAFLEYANASSVDEVRKLPPNSSVLLEASARVESNARWGTVIFGPGIDGHYVPDWPTRAYIAGDYNKDLNAVLTGHANNEGLIFYPSNLTDLSAWSLFLQTSFPDATNATLGYITDVLYPPSENNSNPRHRYNTFRERVELQVAEQHCYCNAYLLSKAYGYKSHNYLFSVPPAIHSEDLSYSFFNGAADQTPPTNLTVGRTSNAYLTHFALTGDPNYKGLPQWPQYGEQGRVLNFTADRGFDLIERDEDMNERCNWWGQALVFGGLKLGTGNETAKRRI